MKRKNTTIVLTLIVNFILSFFGVFVYRDADVPKYCNYWQCIYLSGYTMLSILFVVGALYVLMVYIFSEKGARLSCCIHPVIEILSLLGLQEPFKEICFYTFGHDNGEFSLWGWLMAITAISLFFQLFAAYFLPDTRSFRHYLIFPRKSFRVFATSSGLCLKIEWSPGILT